MAYWNSRGLEGCPREIINLTNDTLQRIRQ